jgi:hypothetical protein
MQRRVWHNFPEGQADFAPVQEPSFAVHPSGQFAQGPAALAQGDRTLFDGGRVRAVVVSSRRLFRETCSGESLIIRDETGSATGAKQPQLLRARKWRCI